MISPYFLCGALVLATFECRARIDNHHDCPNDQHSSQDDGSCKQKGDDGIVLDGGATFLRFDGLPGVTGILLFDEPSTPSRAAVLLLGAVNLPLAGQMDGEK